MILRFQHHETRLLAILCAIATAVVTSPSSATEKQGYLSPQKSATILADGHPWSADTPDGKTLTFTLKKDGTGSIRGPLPFTLTVAWKVTGDVMCITGKMGTKCLRFRVVPGGLQGWDGDKPDLTFSR